MPCYITGTAILPTGSVRPGSVLSFTLATPAVAAVGGALVIPATITTTTGAAGEVALDLMPGRYRCAAVTTTGPASALFTVPDDDTADLAALIAAG